MIHEGLWSPIDLMIQSQWQLSLVLYSFFGVQTSVSCSVFIHTRYNHSFCPGVEFFGGELNSQHQSYWRNKRTVIPECSNYIRGVRGCMLPRKNFSKLGPSETPYPAFPGSNAINSYVHFVKLFSESRYSWFPNRSTKIHDSQVLKQRFMILTFFVTMIHDSASTRYYEKSSWWSKRGIKPRISEMRVSRTDHFTTMSS